MRDIAEAAEIASGTLFNYFATKEAIIARQNFGIRSMLYRLKASIDIRPIAEEEVKATGWDRSEYS